jgi:parallel beta-helix repeat protein
MYRTARLSLLAAFLLFAVPLSAAEGVVEINQTIVEQGLAPCDDGAGFPCTVSEPGSYRLTSNLESTSPNADFIRVVVSDVTIDFNGFAIIGPATCDAFPCANTGSGVGVYVDANVSNVTVLNGTIRGAGSSGVEADASSTTNVRVERLQVDNNGGSGISVFYGGCIVVDSRVSQNGGGGISAGHSEDNRIVGNTVSGNSYFGVSVYRNSLVQGNVVNGNGADGIRCGVASLVLDNTVIDNEGYGLVAVGIAASYSGNVITGNLSGTIDGTMVELGPNLCGTNATCP